ncbi:hypothetical protein Pcinc_013607 [Petrolisthes cinctipes]|uniref:Uncharacterized protein n=1 Tax=Petrolisthes cinctipes TaxID=88211 RepID=A0AAE1FWK1_PETCI|nr:hypothetical protein Pcinc_013607 [Petrolisthes cinctipes]
MTGECPLGFIHLGDECYYFAEEEFNKEEAAAFCSTLSATLASFADCSHFISVSRYLEVGGRNEIVCTIDGKLDVERRYMDEWKDMKLDVEKRYMDEWKDGKLDVERRYMDEWKNGKLDVERRYMDEWKDGKLDVERRYMDEWKNEE